MWQVTSFVPTRKFQTDQLRLLLLGKVGTAIDLGIIKPCFGDVGLAQVTPFWAYCFF